MKRPQLIRFMAIENREKISVQASVNYLLRSQKEIPTPFESLPLLKSYRFEIKLVGLDIHHQVIFKKTYRSDRYGDFDIKINPPPSPIHSFQIFETSRLQGNGPPLGNPAPHQDVIPTQTCHLRLR